MTSVLNRYLKSLGIDAGEMDVLCVLWQSKPLAVNEIAVVLAHNETTLLRRLRTLEARRWVAIATGNDRRERLASLTAHGRRLVTKAIPLWNRAQLEVDQVIRGQVAELTRRLTDLARGG